MGNMRRVLTYLLIICTVFTWTNSTSCEEWSTSTFVKAFSYDDKCYTWSKEKVTWDEAKDVCFDNGGSLVKISSPLIYNALMVSINNSDQCLWIGANDKENEYYWKWLDGSRVTYSDWLLGSFHAFTRYDLDCGTICLASDESSDWNWYQEKCFSRWQFICQYGVVGGVHSSQEYKNSKSKRRYRCKPWPPLGYVDLGQFGSKCYMGSVEQDTWDDAKLNCLHYEGHLVKVPLSDVYTAILSKLNLFRHAICFFIGASDREKEGNWRWTDVSEVLYNDWDLGVWHHLKKYTHDCAGICEVNWIPGDWSWRELQCGDSWNFICEYDAEEIPNFQVDEEKEKPDISKPSVLSTLKTSMYILLPCGTSTRFLSKPDMKITASLFTVCARMCSRLKKCTIVNYNSVTRECVAFSSPKVLRGSKERNENWKTWEIVQKIV